jgi:hypothetical protein
LLIDRQVERELGEVMIFQHLEEKTDADKELLPGR